MAFVTGDTGHTVALVGTHLDEAIIRSVADTRLHPKFGMILPSNVTAYPWDRFCEVDAMATGSLPRKHMPLTRAIIDAICREPAARSVMAEPLRHAVNPREESHGDLNKFLREASLCPSLAA